MYAVIVAVLLIGDAPATGTSDPNTLITDLGSSRYSQRQNAEQALAQLGRTALPALRRAESSADPEVRTRAAVILRRIEGNLLTEPTMISLHFDQVPIAEAIATINHDTGLRLKLMPDLPPLWSSRRITIQTSQALPYWKAIDALCEAGSLHHVFGGQSEFEQGDSTIAIYDGFAAHHGVFTDHGPFRVQLASLHYQSEVHLSNDQGGGMPVGQGGSVPLAATRIAPVASKQFFLQMLVGAEPQLAVAPAGPVKVTEAIDDRGQTLLLPARGEMIQHESGYLGVNSSALVHLRVDLAHPEQPGARLKRIKGLIPLVVSTRKADPLEITIDGAANRTYQQGGVTINVGDIVLDRPDQPPTIDLVVKTSPIGPGADGEADDEAVRAIASPQQLEVLDDAGRMIPWFPSSSFFNGEEAKLTLTLLDRGGPVRPAKIRYHGVVRDRTEIPFEFRDLPIP